MSGIIDRIKMFARSPKGRRLIAEGKRAASDPRKRAQAKQAFGKLRGGKH
ncbi:hypothetical protein [Streptomyces sp. H27-D2]|nr:hypothetical protein [Streptomyces sp. H27-D2]MEC4017591.1 hypothetical protein [Streptomyces sp. H27-D2]